MKTRHIRMITRQWLAGAVVLVLLPWFGIARATTSLDSKLLRADEKRSLEHVSTLLAKGGRLNARGDSGRTILMAATKSGNLELVKFLIDKGLDVNGTDLGDSTALMAAVRQENSDIAKLLVDIAFL